MLVREVMSTPVVSVSPDTSVKEATALLAGYGVTAMPVLDAHGKLVGVLSEADVLIEAFLPDQRAHEKPIEVSDGPAFRRVEDVMNRHVLTVGAQADLAEAAELMVSTVVKSLPVVEHDRVIGMVSRRDLLDVLARGDDLIEAAVDDLLRSAGYDWTADVVDGVVTVTGPVAKEEIELATVLVTSVPGVVGLRFPPQPRTVEH